MPYPFVEALGPTEEERIDNYLEHLRGRDLAPDLETLRFLLEDTLVLHHHPSIGGFILYSRSLDRHFSLKEIKLLLHAILDEYADANVIRHLNSLEYENQAHRQSDGNAQKERTPSPGFIYLLHGAGYYKIGMSANVDSRLTQISPRLPFEVELIYAFPVEDMVNIESLLHEKFADKRTNGEWFKLSEADIGYIKGLGTQDG